MFCNGVPERTQRRTLAREPPCFLGGEDLGQVRVVVTDSVHLITDDTVPRYSLGVALSDKVEQGRVAATTIVVSFEFLLHNAVGGEHNSGVDTSELADQVADRI